MDIHGIDHVEFYVRDAHQAAAQFCQSYGFRVYGLLAGQTGQRSILVGQGGIQVLFTSGLTDWHPATMPPPPPEPWPTPFYGAIGRKP